MKASDLIKNLDEMIKIYGDLDVVFRDGHSFDTYEAKDILVKFQKNENDIYVITNHIYE